MAINLLNDESIQGKWGAPPQLHAPDISGVLSALLRNKQFQQAQTQESIAAAIKNYQAQRHDAAYAEALRNAGLTQGQDISGVDSGDATKLATLIQAQTPDTQRDALLEAQTRLYNAKADEPYAPSRAPYGVDYSEHQIGDTWIGDDGLRKVMTRTGPKLAPVGVQPSDQRTQNENQMLKEQAGLLESKGQMDADKAKQEAEDRAANRPNNPYKLSDQYNRTVNRLKQLQQSKVIPSVQPEASPSPSPAETGDALPTSSPQPQGTPRPSSYASPDQIRMARARQAMDDPQATAAEKEQARKILAGE